MITNELREFVEHVLECKNIDDTDVNKLARDILGDSLLSHDVIDVLVALDRAVATPNANWAEYLVTTVVDYVVWTCRPTGVVGRDLSQWLIATLSVGEGQTANARRIAFEVVREAERCDENLISFAMSRPRVQPAQSLSDSNAALLVA
ncbi:MAG: hypothetical protein ACRCUE_05210 [Bosea sp. (in: a-proteobacteria)]